MELRPLRETTPQSYPCRRRLPAAGSWLRGAMAALGVSAALMVGGCIDGAWPPGEERLGGAMVMTMFECSEEPPAEPQSLYYPGVNDGELCGDQTAFAAIDVEQREELTFSFTYGDNVLVHIIDPAGLEVGQLASSDDEGSLTVDLTAGRWMVAATALDAENAWGMFGLSIEEATP